MLCDFVGTKCEASITKNNCQKCTVKASIFSMYGTCKVKARVYSKGKLLFVVEFQHRGGDALGFWEVFDKASDFFAAFCPKENVYTMPKVEGRHEDMEWVKNSQLPPAESPAFLPMPRTGRTTAEELASMYPNTVQAHPSTRHVAGVLESLFDMALVKNSELLQAEAATELLRVAERGHAALEEIASPKGREALQCLLGATVFAVAFPTAKLLFCIACSTTASLLATCPHLLPEAKHTVQLDLKVKDYLAKAFLQLAEPSSIGRMGKENREVLSKKLEGMIADEKLSQQLLSQLQKAHVQLNAAPR